MYKYIIIFLLICSPVQADWTKDDTHRQWAVTTLLVADWLQTRDIATRPDFYETNPYLGNNPSLTQVDQYFAVCLLGHWMISKQLPPKWRKGWQYVFIITEAGAVSRNYSIGINFRF